MTTKLKKEVYITNVQTNYLLVEGDPHIRNVSIELSSNEFNSKELQTLQKMYSSYKVKLTLEIEEPILDEEERKYLSGVIRPFRDNIKSIKKYGFSTGREYIHIETKDNDMMDMFPFEKGTMYKGMELNKEYTLDDLNL